MEAREHAVRGLATKPFGGRSCRHRCHAGRHVSLPHRSGRSCPCGEDNVLDFTSLMGAEAKCTATFGGRTAEGKALLETDELIFRGGDIRLSIPYKSVRKLDAKDGVMHVTWPEGTVAFDLGPAA